MDVPLRRPGDVHACRLRHVGDRMLPCQECLQRLDEEPGERVSEGKVEGSCRKRSGSERYDFSHKAQWFTTNELVSKSVTRLTSNLAGWLGL